MKDSTFKKYCLMVDEWFVNGRNGTKAYQKFNPTSSDENAKVRFSEIVTISNIQEYIETKQVKASNDLDITLSKQLKRLNDIIESDCKESDKINAIKEQNKLVALYEEHNRQKTDINVNEKVTIQFKNKR
jgi:phage terminase small subunit